VEEAPPHPARHSIKASAVRSIGAAYTTDTATRAPQVGIEDGELRAQLSLDPDQTAHVMRAFEGLPTAAP
jgi:hypothetical protein